MPKYAQIERERQFLLRFDSIDVNGLSRKSITDHYILNTSLRLRIMADNESTIYKLTQKAPANETGEAQITTIYLKKEEFELFNKGKMIKVEKVRYILPWNQYVIGLDKYLSAKEELWIAEVEFSSLEEMHSFEIPDFFEQEVTRLHEYNGFELAKRFQ